LGHFETSVPRWRMSARGVIPDILQRPLSSADGHAASLRRGYVDKGKLVVLDSHLSRIRVGTRFYRPHANPCHLEWIFASTREIPRDGAYADHLWQSHIWRYSEDLTPGHVRSADTNFHRWVEPLNVGLLKNYGTPLLAERLRRLLRPGRKRLKNRLARVTDELVRGIGADA